MQDFTHLILLIGTNPLPNYVVARYFLEKNPQLKKITAIHTPETKDIAYRLRMILKDIAKSLKKDFEYQYLGLRNAGNAAMIQSDIKTKFKLEKGEKFHLNYTGGTKNMSVQAYVVLYTDFADVADLVSGEISFSYLDARKFKLLADGGEAFPEDEHKDMRHEVAISFEDLLRLHDCEKIQASQHANWEKANEVIREFLGTGDLILDFINWKNKVVRKIFYQNDDLAKPARVTLADLQQHPFWPQARRVVAAFPPEHAWQFDQNGVLQIPDSTGDFAGGKGAVAKSIKYLDGDWLEYHVAQRIRQERSPGFELETNWRIIKHQEDKKLEKDFEIDALLLRGYQLCGISITTALGKRSQALCKNKAFEILHRTQQMGGDEARGVLVTIQPSTVAKKIESDLHVDTGSRDQLLVLSLEDLQKQRLWQQITEHMLGKK